MSFGKMIPGFAVSARVTIPLDQTVEITGGQIEIVTPNGIFRIGRDFNGDTVLTAKDGVLVLSPRAANMCVIKEVMP